GPTAERTTLGERTPGGAPGPESSMHVDSPSRGAVRARGDSLSRGPHAARSTPLYTPALNFAAGLRFDKIRFFSGAKSPPREIMTYASIRNLSRQTQDGDTPQVSPPAGCNGLPRLR